MNRYEQNNNVCPLIHAELARTGCAPCISDAIAQIIDGGACARANDFSLVVEPGLTGNPVEFPASGFFPRRF